MQLATQTAPTSKKMIWTGHIIAALPILFLLFDSIIHIIGIAPVVASLNQLGYPVGLALSIGTIEIVCVALYAFPPTSFLGAVLLTGYLGGAIAVHMRVGDPLFSTTLFPVYLGILIWGGLYLRDSRLRALLPLQRK